MYPMNFLVNANDNLLTSNILTVLHCLYFVPMVFGFDVVSGVLSVIICRWIFWKISEDMDKEHVFILLLF